MPIPFTCPNCQRTGRLPDSFTGDKVKCPACETVSPIKRASGSKPAAPARNPAFDHAETEPMLRSPSPRAAGGARGKLEPAKAGLPVGVIVGGSVGTAVLAIVIAVVAVVMSRPGDKPQANVARNAPADADETAEAPAKASVKPAVAAATPTSSPTAVQPTAAPLTASTSGKPVLTSPGTTPTVTTLGSITTPTESPEETVQRIKDATVYIEVKSEGTGASGSGFVIQVSGDTVLVASNHHVVAVGDDDDEEADPAEAVKKGMVTVYFRSGRGAGVEQSAPGTVIAWDREGNRDLALVEVKGVKNPPKPIDISPNSDVKLSETMPALIYGFPFGNIDKGLNSAVQGGPSITVAKGSISSLRLNEHGKVSYVQIDSSMNHGNSGGPVVDEKGRLIGVAVSKLRDSTIGFAVPKAELNQMLEGRLAHLSIAYKSEKDGQADLTVVTRVIDPMHKVHDVGFLYVPATGPNQALPKLGSDGFWPPIPGATQVRLTVKDQLAGASIQAPTNPGGGRKLIVQSSYLDSRGKTIYSNPVTYDIPTEPTGLVAIGLPPGRDAPKLPPTFDKLGPLENAATKAVKMLRDNKSVTFDLPAGVHVLSPEWNVKNAPMTLADVSGDFVAQVRVVGEMLPGVDKPVFKGQKLPFTFQGAGLVFWLDKNNYIRLERTAGAGGAGTMINKLLVEACKEGKDAGHFYLPVPEGELYLRMSRRYSAIQCWVGNGRGWATFPKLAVSFPSKARIGLSASNVSKEPCSRRFEEFVLITEPKKVKALLDN